MLSPAPLIVRLAWRNVRRRPWQAVLLLFTLSLATTTSSLALAVTESGNRGWDRVAEATHGFHVYAKQGYWRGAAPAERDQVRNELSALAAAPGVVAAGGPWRTLFTTMDAGRVPIDLRVQVRDPAPAAVDQPLLTSGGWLDGDDGVVLEDGLASTLDLTAGDTVTIAGLRLPVRGTALTVSVLPYPLDQPAIVWVGRALGARLAAAATGGYEWIELRLARPGDAAAFAAAHLRTGRELHTWQDRRQGVGDDLAGLATTLLLAATMLVGLTTATAGVLVAGRMIAQTRQTGTLKAVGVTPRQVVGVLLTEYLAVAGMATMIGLAAGTLLAPYLARTTRTLYGAQAVPITWPRAVAVAVVAGAVVLVAAVRPAMRGIRRSTLRSLDSAARPPFRAARLGRAGAALRLPLPIVLGLRAALRRPGRTVGTTVGLTVATAMVVIGLALDDSTEDFRRRLTPNDTDPVSLAATTAAIERLLAVVIVSAVVLLALAAVNASVAASFAARDSARNHAILRTVGATPRQAVLAFVTAQLIPCLLACALGIPGGIALFNAARGDLAPVRLSALIYVAIAVALPAVYVLLVAVPARLLARQPIVPHLTYD